MIRVALLTVAAAVIVGCSSLALTRLEPGKSSEADVRRALGEPARVFTHVDGSRQLVFPQGPEGVQTFMAHVAPDGSLVRLEQVLAESQFRRIVRGSTTGGELERLIGPPWRTVDFSRKRQVAWDYVFQDDWGYTVDFSVMLDERGVVAETIYARRDTGDAGMN